MNRKTVIIAAAVAVAGIGAYLYLRGQKPKDPAQAKQPAAPMPRQANPSPFQRESLAYAPGASPLLTQVGQGTQIGLGVLDAAKGLGFFGGGGDDFGSDDAA